MIVRRKRCVRVRREPRARKEIGSYLVEVLIAVLVASVLSTALAKMFSQSWGVTNSTQAQVMIAAISQEVVDQLRSLQYETVAANQGYHEAVVNGAGNNDTLFPRSLLQDSNMTYHQMRQLTNGTWQLQNVAAGGAMGALKVVDNIAVIEISQRTANSLNVEITIRWQDGSGTHLYNTNTVLTKFGINS